MDKKQLTSLIDDKFKIIHDWISMHDDDKFDYTSREGKWTTGQHIEHLVISTSLTNKAFKIPKFVLKWKFGVNNRSERTYEETVQRYIHVLDAKGIKAPPRFSPSTIENNQKAQKINELMCQGKNMIKQINKLSEEQLSKYIIPHPALGYMTFREMGYFTAYHTEHHLNILKEYHM